MGNVHTIVNLDDRIRLTNQELKHQVYRADRRRKVDRVGMKRPCTQIASVDIIYRRVIEHYTHEAFGSGTLVEVGSESQGVRLAHRDHQILTHIRWVHIRAGVN